MKTKTYFHHSVNFAPTVVAMIAMAASAVPAIAATNISACGTILTNPGDYVVSVNLTCAAGDGIIIKGSRIDVKLNGKIITGGGVGIGVNIFPASGRLNHVTVEGPGLVRGFSTGVSLNMLDYGQIDLSTVANNSTDGISVNSSTFISVQSNTTGNNVAGGIVFNGSSSSVAQYNNSSHNAVGILISASATSVTANNNTADGNATYGIQVTGTGSRLFANVTNANIIGIGFLAPGNQAFNNSSSQGNTSWDLFDSSATCSGNLWNSNNSLLRNQTCIK